MPSREGIAAWNPAALDTDEWARVAASFGAKYIVLVADHMTGFTLWDTKFHNYSIAHTMYKGGGADVVKELIASCKKWGSRSVSQRGAVQLCACDASNAHRNPAPLD